MNEEEYLRAELASAKKHIEYCGQKIFGLEAKLDRAKQALEHYVDATCDGGFGDNGEIARAALKEIQDE